VWASLALCGCYSLEDHLLRYRTEAAVVSAPSNVSAEAGTPQQTGAHNGA
jgi:hypothetical protein